MENDIRIFNNPMFGDIRTAGTADNPLFCLADLCRVLELQVTPTKNRLDQRGVNSIKVGVQTGIKKDGNPAMQDVDMIFVNEKNMYKTIMRSDKQQAEPFQDWVCGEVLPTIRKTGGYIVASNDMTDEEILAKALLVAQTTIEKRNERIKQLECKVQTDAPKVEYFDNLVDRGLNIGFGKAAKEIGVKQNVFVDFLLENKYVYRNKKKSLQPYADYNNDLFVVKDAKSDTNKWAGTQTLVTPKGKETFRLLLNK